MAKKYVIIFASLAVIAAAVWFIFKPAAESTFIVKHEAGVQIEENQMNKFKELQKLLNEENDLYSQIIEGGKKNVTDVTELIKNAKKTIKKSEELLNVKDATMQESYKVTKKSFLYAKKISDKKLKSHAEQLTSLYKKRYEISEGMNKAYKEALALESKLYNRLSSNDSTMKDISENVTALSSVYEKINKLEKEFSSITKQYNNTKKAYYQGLSA